MRECVPHRRLPPRHNLPWLSKSLVQLMKRRNMLFSRSKRSKKKSDFEKYKKLRNRVTTQLRDAKTSFFRQINPRDTKKFWKSVKYLNKNQSSIPVLSQGNTLACTDSAWEGRHAWKLLFQLFQPGGTPTYPRGSLYVWCCTMQQHTRSLFVFSWWDLSFPVNFGH